MGNTEEQAITLLCEVGAAVAKGSWGELRELGEGWVEAPWKFPSKSYYLAARGVLDGVVAMAREDATARLEGEDDP